MKNYVTRTHTSSMGACISLLLCIMAMSACNRGEPSTTSTANDNRPAAENLISLDAENIETLTEFQTISQDAANSETPSEISAIEAARIEAAEFAQSNLVNSSVDATTMGDDAGVHDKVEESSAQRLQNESDITKDMAVTNSVTHHSEHDGQALSDDVIGIADQIDQLPDPVTPTAEQKFLNSAAEQAALFEDVLANFIEKRTSLPTGIKPAYQHPLEYLEQRQIDTVWNTLTRISSEEVFGGYANHAYSRRQPWNADETLLDVGNKILNTTDYSVQLSDIQISAERNWSNIYPDTMYGIYWNDLVNRLVRYDVLSDSVTEIVELHGFNSCTMGNSEGMISQDDKWVVLSCVANGDSEQHKTLLNVSLSDGMIKARMQAAPNMNWASVSPSGKFIMVENNNFPDPSAELYIYDSNFKNARYAGKPSHGDFGFDNQGNEVFVQVGESEITYVVLESAIRYLVNVAGESNPAGYGHISCRNSFRAGWCYISSRLNDVVGAFLVSHSQSQFELWGAHRSSYTSYRSQPKAVPNRFGTKVLFSSDWNGAIGPSDFVLELLER